MIKKNIYTATGMLVTLQSKDVEKKIKYNKKAGETNCVSHNAFPVVVDPNNLLLQGEYSKMLKKNFKIEKKFKIKK